MPSWSLRDPPPPVDVTRLNDDELLDFWMSNRNNHHGVVAADERMKREWTRRDMRRQERCQT